MLTRCTCAPAGKPSGSSPPWLLRTCKLCWYRPNAHLDGNPTQQIPPCAYCPHACGRLISSAQAFTRKAAKWANRHRFPLLGVQTLKKPHARSVPLATATPPPTAPSVRPSASTQRPVSGEDVHKRRRIRRHHLCALPSRTSTPAVSTASPTNKGTFRLMAPAAGATRALHGGLHLPIQTQNQQTPDAHEARCGIRVSAHSRHWLFLLEYCESIASCYWGCALLQTGELPVFPRWR